MTDRVVRLALDARDLARELGRERREVARVDPDPGLFHVDQDVHEGQLDLAEQLRQPQPLQVLAEEGGQAHRGDRRRPCACEALVQRR